MFELAGFAGFVFLVAASATGQVRSCASVELGDNLPPANSPPLVRCLEVIVHPDDRPSIDPQTYLYYLNPVQPSLRSQRKWIPYKERDVLAGFDRLWRTRFLDDLWVEVIDEAYENGVIGKHVVFHLEELPRIKSVEYRESGEIGLAKIEEALKAKGIGLGGTFFEFDDSTIAKVKAAIMNVYVQGGYPNATVAIRKTPIPGGSRQLSLTFEITAGAKIIR